MIPDPLHPAIVHFPIALVFLLPLAAGIAWMAIRRGAGVRQAWGWVVALSAALLLSSWVAVQTGEVQEEVVERVVAERPLHDHEEAAEMFLLLSLGGLIVFAAGLGRGPLGRASRIAGLVAGAVLLVSGVTVGRGGGALVYEHGAATAYTSPRATPPPLGSKSDARDREEREEREDRHRRR
jgi:uncharacterized membrane protein